MRKFYVYKYTNLINNKIYIGKSNNPKLRWYRHVYDAKNIKEGSKQLLFHRAINKYGPNNFVMEILSEYDYDKEALIGECFYIKTLKSNDLNIGYNLTSGGEGVAGYSRTPEQNLAISIRNTGNQNGMYGKVKSLEQRKLLSKKVSITKRKNIFKSHKISEETIEKLKVAVKEKKSQKLTDQQKDEIIALYNSEKIIKRDLAIQFNIEEKTIQYVIRYWNKIKNNKTKHLSEEIKTKIINLYLEKKHTKKQISELVSISLNRIESLIKMYQRRNEISKLNK